MTIAFPLPAGGMAGMTTMFVAVELGVESKPLLGAIALMVGLAVAFGWAASSLPTTNRQLSEDDRGQQTDGGWFVWAALLIGLTILGLVIGDMVGAVEAANLSNVTETRGLKI